MNVRCMRVLLGSKVDELSPVEPVAAPSWIQKCLSKSVKSEKASGLSSRGRCRAEDHFAWLINVKITEINLAFRKMLS